MRTTNQKLVSQDPIERLEASVEHVDELRALGGNPRYVPMVYPEDLRHLLAEYGRLIKLVEQAATEGYKLGVEQANLVASTELKHLAPCDACGLYVVRQNLDNHQRFLCSGRR